MKLRAVAAVFAAGAVLGCQLLPAQLTSPSLRPTDSSVPATATALPPTSSPGTTPKLTQEPTDPPAPTDMPTPTPTPTPTPWPPALGWERIGTLGPAGSVDVEFEWIEAMVGFDDGYLAVESATTDRNRFWFSADGADWHEVTSFGDEQLVERSYSRLAVATNGADVIFFAEGATDYVTRAWISPNGADWTGHELEFPTDDEYGPLAVWPSAGGWQAALYETYEDKSCDPYTCERIVLWESVDGSTWQRRSEISDGAFGAEVGGAQAPDGTILVEAEGALLASSDGGETFTQLDNTGRCTDGDLAALELGPLTGAIAGGAPWVVGGKVFEGGAQLCLGNADGSTWEPVLLESDFVYANDDLDATRYGLLLSATRDCFEVSGCPPYREFFLSLDGREWVALEDAAGLASSWAWLWPRAPPASSGSRSSQMRQPRSPLGGWWSSPRPDRRRR